MNFSESIIIADDHPLVLKGLKDFLFENGHQVIASAKNGKEALNLIKAHQPHIAILDIRMPYLSGIEVAQEIKKLKLKTKVILITFEKSPLLYEESKNADVYGYILKEFALEELENCLRAVYMGQSYFSPELLEEIDFSKSPKLLQQLTYTEKKVCELLASNKTGAEIADSLNISIRTVEKHKSTIRQKVKLDSKPASLYLFAYKHLQYL